MPTYWNSTNTLQFSTVDYSGSAIIDALLSADWRAKWGGAAGTGVNITYSIPGNLVGDVSYWESGYSGTNEPGSLGYVGAAIVQAFEAALQVWADVANISFTRIADATTSNGAVGDIRLAFYNNMAQGQAGWAYYPSYSAASGDIWLNPSADWSGANLAPGANGFGTLVHELGHALGLDHPLGAGATPGYDESTTVMSYNQHPHGLFRDVTQNGNSYQWTYSYVAASTPMLYDIAAIQYLYGANLAHRTGDDIYTFASDVPFFATIWDAGGTDTISISNFTLGSVIDLREGAYSSIRIPSDPLPPGQTETRTNIYDGTDNLAIAFGVTIENAIGGSGNDELIGNAVANRLEGLEGNDRMLGWGGSDVLLGGAGNDTLNGGGGADLVNGGEGADYLIGGAGNDTLDGGTGADRMLGGAGNDIYYVDDTGDVVTESPGAGIDLVRSTISHTLRANVEKLVLLGAGDLGGTGNVLDNWIIGNVGANVLLGASGNDTVNGGAGNDTLNGGNGNDSLNGGAGNDRLIGGGGNDTLIGGNGSDVLIGDAGKDFLTGGLGADTFVFNAAGHSAPGTARDVITDFSRAQGDRVNLSGIDANPSLAGDQAFVFIGNAAFGADATGQLRFAGGILYGSTDVDTAAEFSIQLTGVTSLLASDIIA